MICLIDRVLPDTVFKQLPPSPDQARYVWNNPRIYSINLLEIFQHVHILCCLTFFCHLPKMFVIFQCYIYSFLIIRVLCPFLVLRHVSPKFTLFCCSSSNLTIILYFSDFIVFTALRWFVNLVQCFWCIVIIEIIQTCLSIFCCLYFLQTVYQDNNIHFLSV